MQSDNSEFNASGDIANLPLHHTNVPCFAKLAACRHIILKERLTPRAGTAGRKWLAARSIARNRAEIGPRMAYSELIRRQPPGCPSQCCVHDLLLDGTAHRKRVARAVMRPHDSDHAGMRGRR